MKIIRKKIHGKESRKEMMAAIDLMAKVVGSTMGARGRNVILDKEFGAPLVINDGVTIAREIFFDNNVENVAAQLVKDAAIKTNELAGDGTTGATVLANAIIQNGWKEVNESGVNPVQLRKELESAALRVSDELKKHSREIQSEDDVIKIAKISVQDDVIGTKIGKTMYKIGAHGAVTVKNSIKPGVFFEKSGGMQIQGQLKAGVFDNMEKWETKLDSPHVLILHDSPEDHEFESKWIPLIRQFSEGTVDQDGNLTIKKVHVPTLLVIAEKLSRRFIMVANQNKHILKWCWFRPSTAGINWKEIMKDIHSIVGGKIVDEEEGVFLSKMSINDLGKAELAIVDRHSCVLAVPEKNMASEDYLDRVNVVKGQMENAEDEVEKEQIRDRYASLTGGVAEIRVSAATDQDTNELRLRIEDALNATRSAMEAGIVPGGGVALFNASQVLRDAKTVGDEVLLKACEAPIRQILKNAGWEDDKINSSLKKLKTGEGIDVMTDSLVDMVKAGIIDPFKVINLALLNATSVGGLLLTSEYLVTNEEDDTDRVKKFFTGK